MRYFNTVKPIKIARSKGRERSFPREEKEISREASWDIRNSPLCRCPYSGPPTDITNNQRCVSNSSQHDWQCPFNRPIMARTQILVHWWWSRTRISALFRRRTEVSQRDLRLWRRLFGVLTWKPVETLVKV